MPDCGSDLVNIFNEHFIAGMLLRHVFRTGFSTLLVWALAIFCFLLRSGGSITITWKTFFPGRSSRMWISTTKGVWLPGVLEQAQCFGIFFCSTRSVPRTCRCYTHRSCSAGERSSERSLTLMGSNTAIPPGEPRQCCVYKAFVKYHCCYIWYSQWMLFFALTT